MRLIVAGGRDFEDYARLCKILDCIHSKYPTLEVVCGKAKGADTLGEKWALSREVDIEYFPADWDLHGKSAGYIRNREMGDYSTHLVALWDGESRGTKGMIEYMQKLNKPYAVYEY